MWTYAVAAATAAGLVAALAPQFARAPLLETAAIRSSSTGESVTRSGTTAMPELVLSATLRGEMPPGRPDLATALRLSPPFEPVDVFRFRAAGDLEVTLADIDGPGRSESCTDAAGRRWSCGADARVALYNLIKGSEIDCLPLSYPHAKAVVARCHVGEDGLGVRLVQAGWARPSADAGAEITTAFAQAQAAHRGLWAEAAPQ
jgi:endonuclease YncB( thermonuclease family)